MNKEQKKQKQEKLYREQHKLKMYVYTILNSDF